MFNSSKWGAIYQKEVRGFLFSPQFYVVCFICASFLSFSYPIALSQFKQSLATSMFQQGANQQMFNIHYAVFLQHLSRLNLVLIFIVPALTMRLFAEEKKLRTMDLLLTSPITSAQIVVGKYLAALSAIGALSLLALSYPAITSMYTKVQWVPLLIATFGIFIVGAVYAAMDLFCSALTESAIVCYVMAVMFNVSIWFIGMAVEVVDTGLVRQIFEHLSLNQHLVSLVEGTIRTSTLVFFASLIFLFCFLAERVVESARWR